MGKQKRLGMNMKQSKKLLKSELLENYPLIFGFTTKLAGNFRYDNLDNLGKLFKIDPKNIITMHQTHRDDILSTKFKNKFLVVKIADCVPILFYDPVNKIVAVCHAGWRGTLLKVAQKTVSKMGSDPKNIITVLGPHICSKCYDVPQERAQKFKNYFNKNNKFYLDLGRENIDLLKTSGVQIIEDLNICTSCQNNLLYSYRKDGPSHGEQVGLIGMI